MCRNAISSIFRNSFIENIEDLTGLKLQDVCKINYQGCFVGMTHKNFPFVGFEFSSRIFLSDQEYIKKQVDKWIKNDNNDIIAKVFKTLIKTENNKLSILKVREMFGNSYCDLTLNKKKRQWHLVFSKDKENYSITNKALEYLQKIQNNKVSVTLPKLRFSAAR